MKRFIFSLSACAIAVISQAAVHYHYETALTSIDITTSTFITSTQTFNASEVDAASIFLSDFRRATFIVDAGSNDVFRFRGSFLGIIPFVAESEFAEGSFGAFGTYTSLGDGATLTVYGDAPPAAPSPAAMIPFALGGIATLRRRR